MVGLSPHDFLRGFWFPAAVTGTNLLQGNAHADGSSGFRSSDSSDRKAKAGPWAGPALRPTLRKAGRPR